MSDDETREMLNRLDPDPPRKLTEAQRREFSRSPHVPAGEDLEDGEIFDEATGAFANPGWVPPLWVPPSSEDDRAEIDQIDP